MQCYIRLHSKKLIKLMMRQRIKKKKYKIPKNSKIQNNGL